MIFILIVDFIITNVPLMKLFRGVQVELYVGRDRKDSRLLLKKG